MRNSLAVAVVVTVLAAVAGCGGGEDGSLNRGEYVKQADEICGEANARLEEVAKDFPAVGAEGPGPREIDQIEALTKDAFVPVIRDQVGELRALAPPQGDEDRLDRLYNMTEKALDAIEADPQLVLRVADPFAEAARQAKGYGFQECFLGAG